MSEQVRPPGAPEEGSTLWRKVHRATPLIKSWQVLVGLTVALAFYTIDDIIMGLQEFQFPGLVIIAIVLGAIVVVLAVSLVYSYFAWRRTAYAIGEDAVYFHKGIFFRSQRHARLNRIQGVDISRPLLGRLVGLSSLVIEAAGGADSKVVIEYLKDEEAERLRTEILARAAGLSALTAPSVQPIVQPSVQRGRAVGQAGAPEGAAGEGAAAEGANGEGAPAQWQEGTGAGPVTPVFARAPERVVYELPAGQLVKSLLFSGSLISMVVIGVIGVVLAAFFTEGWGALVLLPLVFTAGAVMWTQFSGHFGHTMAISPDGIRLRHGLLTTTSQTIPPGRIQAIRLSQPLLWRRLGWWRLEMDVAGYGPDAGDSGNDISKNVLLPVAPREIALEAVWIVQRDLGVDDPDAVLSAGLTGRLGDAGFLHSPRSARWVDPISWKRNGLLITRTVMLMRGGRITRRLVFVPHERTQSLAAAQGPLQRRLRVATFEAHSVPGPILPKVQHLPEDLAMSVLADQASRAREARAKEGPEEWMRRVSDTTPIVSDTTPIMDE
ncbi:MAG TPA: PH domain-containing protein [Actinomycetaceae bacterium]|nr:PH domain-containing protein [Actinomycetaceae bacterium]